MIFNKKRRSQYRRSLEKLPERLRSTKYVSKKLIQKKDQRHIAVTIDGGMGDYIVASRFMRDISQHVVGLKIDVFCKKTQLARWILSHSQAINEILDTKIQGKYMRHVYAANITCLNHLSVEYYGTSNRELLRVLNEITRNTNKIRRLTEQPPHFDGYIGMYASIKGENRYTFLQKMAGIDYGGDKLDVPSDERAIEANGLAGKDYITVSNGFDLNAAKDSRCELGSTKVYPHFDALCALIKSRHPNITIVQIGNSSSTPISSADINLIDKTSLNEVSEIIKGSKIHIDNEGGLVHLARCHETACCVIFGPTDIRYFGYPQNVNIPPATCGNCWWMEETWMTVCVKGMHKPACLYERDPGDVYNAIANMLLRLSHQGPSRLDSSCGD